MAGPHVKHNSSTGHLRAT